MKRFLKVYQKSVKKFSGFQNAPTKIRLFPQIIIQGDYLNQFGFFPGDRIRVNLEQDKIIITKIK